jgi:hypothetical protein
LPSRTEATSEYCYFDAGLAIWNKPRE